MKALRLHGLRPASRPLLADDILEFHAGRLVLLIAVCGGPSAKIKGLTKMAKLDFFVRYPDFFAVVRGGAKGGPVEAAMVRHHYGPWDKRYYHVLAFLESRALVTVARSGKSVHLSLTKTGKALSNQLIREPAFADLVAHMQKVASAFASQTGSELKSLIYRTFGEDIGERPLGHIIGGKN